MPLTQDGGGILFKRVVAADVDITGQLDHIIAAAGIVGVDLVQRSNKCGPVCDLKGFGDLCGIFRVQLLCRYGVRGDTPPLYNLQMQRPGEGSASWQRPEAG